MWVNSYDIETLKTHMISPSSSGWRLISELPDDRKDGRRVLLWEEDQAVIGRWDSYRHGWQDPENMHLFEEISYWADILFPEPQEPKE